jgi:hypothetical protein
LGGFLLETSLNDGLGGVDSLFKGHVGRVKQDGVFGGTEGRVGAIAVALVTGSEVGDDFLRLHDRLAVFAAELIVATEAADFRRGVEEDFDFSMGKDDSADVAAFHDDAAGLGKLLLEADHPGANDGEDTDFGGRVGDGLIAKQAGDVFTVEQDAVFIFAGLEMNGGFSGEGFKGGVVVKREANAESLEAEGAVHGACFQIEEAEMAGQMAGYGAFARP